MKIFAISDIHSFYTPMKKALDEAGFEPGNENHLLVICGDIFDRGDESYEVLKYIKSVPNKVLIHGNHEDLISDCIDRGEPWSHDFSNGTYKTICDLGGAGDGRGFEECCNISWNLLKHLFEQTKNYFETEHYIFVHSFIPLTCKDNHPKYHTKHREFEYDPDWRYAHASYWETARWGNPFDLADNGLNQTGKIIVHGHWHNSAGWADKNLTSEWGDDACFDICEHNGCIGLDACTAYSGKVNVLVIEDELLQEE